MLGSLDFVLRAIGHPCRTHSRGEAQWTGRPVQEERRGPWTRGKEDARSLPGDVGIEMPLDETVSLGSRPPAAWRMERVERLRTLSPELQGFESSSRTKGGHLGWQGVGGSLLSQLRRSLPIRTVPSTSRVSPSLVQLNDNEE